MLYICNARALQRERVFRDRMNPLDNYSDKRMHKYYRFTRNGVMRVLDIVTPHLQNKTERSHAIDPRVQVFVALRFYATGDFYSSTSAHHGISEASVCRIIHKVRSRKLHYLPSCFNKVKDAGVGPTGAYGLRWYCHPYKPQHVLSCAISKVAVIK